LAFAATKEAKLPQRIEEEGINILVLHTAKLIDLKSHLNCQVFVFLYQTFCKRNLVSDFLVKIENLSHFSSNHY